MKAYIGLSVPNNIKTILETLDVPGIKEDSSGYHITMIYFGKDVSFKDLILPAIEAVFDFAAEVKPFQIELEKIDSFPEGKDGIPIICPVISKDLQKIRKDLAKLLNQQKLEFDQKFPDYKPHVTLAYNKEEKSFKSQKLLSPLSWTATDLVLYAGYPGPNKIEVRFPFGLNKNSKTQFLTDLFCKLS